jgi:hypothetical protein
MTSEWTTEVHPGYRTKTIKVGNCTIEINRPILTPEEQKKREDQVIEALKRFGKEKQYEQN